MARLAEVDDTEPEEIDNALDSPVVSETPDRPVPLAEQRRGAVLAAIRSLGAHSVGDFGCGEGVLVRDLLAERSVERVVATDVSARALQIAARKLRLERMPELQRARLEIFQSSLTYRDNRLTGLDAAVLMEVIEHVDPPRLEALERAVFGFAAPRRGDRDDAEQRVQRALRVLAPGAMRHRDHRFEWTRGEFHAWADRVASTYGYAVRYLPVGTDDPEVGPPTQLALFTKGGAA